MINAAMKIIDITHIAIQIRRRLNLFLHMIKVSGIELNKP